LNGQPVQCDGISTVILRSRISSLDPGKPHCIEIELK
jgi:hypothetical protein